MSRVEADSTPKATPFGSRVPRGSIARDTINSAMHPGHYFAALLSAALLFASFPPLDIGWLAWFALLPILAATTGRGRWHGFALGFVFGLVVHLIQFYWLYALPGYRLYHGLLLSSFYALFLALWGSALGGMDRSARWLPVHAAALWVVLLFVRDHAGFMALPWLYLGAAQTSNIAILQLAQWGGVYLIDGVIVACTVLLFQALALRQMRRFVGAASLMVVVHSIGWFSQSDETAASLRVAIIQPALPPDIRETEAGAQSSLQTLAALHAEASAGKPDMAVWPESAVRDVKAGSTAHNTINHLVNQYRIPILTGVSEPEKFADAQNNPQRREFNSAYWIGNDSIDWPVYRKIRLLPFGEYRPLDTVFTWPQWLAPRVFEVTPGTQRTGFDFPNHVRGGTLICWESLFSEDARDSVADGARVLAVLVNDGWFHSATASAQHNLASVLRAAELQVPVIVASNTGPSLLIDRHGRVTLSTRPDTPGIITGEVRVPHGPSLYAVVGDVFCGLSLLWVIGWVCRTIQKRTEAWRVSLRKRLH